MVRINKTYQNEKHIFRVNGALKKSLQDRTYSIKRHEIEGLPVFEYVLDSGDLAMRRYKQNSYVELPEELKARITQKRLIAGKDSFFLVENMNYLKLFQNNTIEIKDIQSQKEKGFPVDENNYISIDNNYMKKFEGNTILSNAGFYLTENNKKVQVIQLVKESEQIPIDISIEQKLFEFAKTSTRVVPLTEISKVRLDNYCFDVYEELPEKYNVIDSKDCIYLTPLE